MISEGSPQEGLRYALRRQPEAGRTLAPAGERPDPSQLSTSHRLGDVSQLVTNHERSIEWDAVWHGALVYRGRIWYLPNARPLTTARDYSRLSDALAEN